MRLLDRLFEPTIRPMFGCVYEARDQMRALIVRHRPELLAEFDQVTTKGATFQDFVRFMNTHFPEHDWGPELPHRSPAILERIIISSATDRR